MIEPYTVALTSCGRFDLLQRTLYSLLPRLDGPIAEILIAEDSADHRVHDIIAHFGNKYGEIKVIVNNPPLGQIRSIDRLYAQIKTEWIFHCEDDWEFFADGFIEKSFSIMQEFDFISTVLLRDSTGLEPDFYFGSEAISSCGTQYWTANPKAEKTHSEYAGLSFNPGLRRMRDYRIIGPYNDLQYPVNERQVAGCYFQLGYLMAFLNQPAVRHIGWDQPTKDWTKQKNFIEKIKHSIRKRITKIRLKINPSLDPVLKARNRLEKVRSKNWKLY